MFIRLKSKRHGFLLYETIIALLITIITLGILQQSLLIFKSINQTSFRNQLRWHVTQEKLQEYLQNNEIKAVQSNKIIFVDQNDNKTKVIEKYSANSNCMLRLRRATGKGHEPIMTNLRQIRIEKIRNLVIITTVNSKSQRSEMLLVNNYENDKSKT